MSPTDSTRVQITGRPGFCEECHTPWCEPVPPRYPLTVSGPVDNAVITLHTPTCIRLRKVREGAAA